MERGNRGELMKGRNAPVENTDRRQPSNLRTLPDPRLEIRERNTLELENRRHWFIRILKRGYTEARDSPAGLEIWGNALLECFYLRRKGNSRYVQIELRFLLRFLLSFSEFRNF